MQAKSSTKSKYSATRGVADQLRQTADVYRLRVKRDECGDPFIPGRRGKLYVYDESLLAVLFASSSKIAWSRTRRKLLGAGFALIQDGDTEGTASFDPLKPEQATLAIKVAGVKSRRRVSPETRARLACLSKSRRSIAGKALMDMGTTAGAGRYIPPHSSHVGPESGSPATERIETVGAK